MIQALLFVCAMSICTPDLSHVREDQVELHPALGIVIALDNGVRVAYPSYPPVYVQQCDYLISKDTFNLTFRFCYGKMLYILGEPTMWQVNGSSEWHSMDDYKCREKGE